MLRFSLHSAHSELAGVVHRLREDLEILVLRPTRNLKPDVINGRPDHEAEWLETSLAQKDVLSHRQVRREDAGRVGTRRMGEAAGRCLRLPTGACRNPKRSSPKSGIEPPSDVASVTALRRRRGGSRARADATADPS